MTGNIEKKLFKIFNIGADEYEIYKLLNVFVREIVEETKGIENARFYEVLRLLSNSINNAGCEERRSEQIAMIHKASQEIADKYEAYLP